MLLHFVIGSTTPLLASRARKAGEPLFAVANSRRTAYALIGALVVLLLLVYPFVGLMRIEVRLGDEAEDLALIERSWIGDGTPQPRERTIATARVTPFRPWLRPYLTRPGDPRVFRAMVGLRYKDARAGPLRRTPLTVDRMTEGEKKLPRVLIAPTLPLFALVRSQNNFRLKVNTGEGASRKTVEPYQGQLVWISDTPFPAEDLSAQDKKIQESQPAWVRIEYKFMALEPVDTIVIDLEIKKHGASEWVRYDDSYPVTATVTSDRSTFQEVTLDAKQ
jgi:hypothetical protein